jgi:lipopolysaccharide transport system permease protein
MHRVIRPRRGLAAIDLRELWEARELLGFMAWRDVTVRYRQTVVGVLWAFIRPFLTMVVFTVIFSKLAKLPSDGVPYAILIFTAQLPWQFFATAFPEAANSVVGNAHMVQKIYFPRLILPLASVGVGVVDFLVSLVFLGAIMAWYRFLPSPHIWAMPLFFVLCLFFTIGMGLFFGALYVRYRDMRHLIPFITLMGIYVSPVAYSSSLIPARWRLLYSLNPMVAVIDGFRWSLLGAKTLYVPGLLLGIGVSIVLFIAGLFYFKTAERAFADVI